MREEGKHTVNVIDSAGGIGVGSRTEAGSRRRRARRSHRVLAALACGMGITCGDDTGGVAGPAEAPNRAPVAVGEIPAQSVFLGETATVVVSPYFSDPEGRPLDYGATSSDDAVATANVSGSDLVIGGVLEGTATVTVTAADPLGASTGQSFAVTVERPNQPPVVTRAISPQTVGESESVSVSLDAYFSDPEGGPLDYGATSSDDAVATANVSGSDLVIGGVLEGTATVTVTAADSLGASTGQSFAVTVETSGTTNQPPVVTRAISPQTVGESESVSVSLDAYFSDPEGGPLDYGATSSDDAVATATVSGSDLVIGGVLEGTATVTVTAADSLGASTGQSFAVTVETSGTTNQPPVVTRAISPQTVGESESVSVSLDAYFSDPEGGPLDYGATSSDDAVATATVSGSDLVIGGVLAGTATVTVTAADSLGASTGQSFAVTVERPNQPPVVTRAISPQTVGESESVSVSLDAYFSDPEGGPLDYGATSSDDAVATATVSGSDLVIGGVLAGTATVTVTAADSLGASTGQSFAVTVERPNQPPVVTRAISPQTVEESESVSVSLDAYFSDPEGGPLDYGATSSDDAVATATVSGSDLVIGGVLAGTATVTVTAADSLGASTGQSFAVTVERPNQPPVVTRAIPAQTVGESESVSVSLDAYFSDPEGGPLDYGATSSDDAVATATVSGSDLVIGGVLAGTATVTVTAADSLGASTGQSFAVTVERPNQPPVVTRAISPQTVEESESVSVSLDAYFSDPEGGPLDYGATSSDDAVATATVSGSDLVIGGVLAGTATVTVTAADSLGASTGQSFAVTVERPNQPPVVTRAIPAQTVEESESVSVSLDAYFSDPEGGPLDYGATSSDDAVATATVSGSDLVIGGVLAGTATVTVTAADSLGASTGQSFAVTVERPNQPPVVTRAISPQTVEESESVSVSLDAYFSDPEGGPLDYGATSSDDAVATATVSGSDLVIGGVLAGTATVTVTAADSLGASTGQSFAVTVERPNQPPVVTRAIPAQTVEESESVSVSLDAYFSDPEGGPLDYGATSSDDAVATATVSGSDLVIGGVLAGTATVTVTARDRGGLTVQQQFGVTVETSGTTNQAPVVVQQISDRTLGVGKSFGGTVAQYFSDPDNDPLRYSASSSNPGAVTAITAHLPLLPAIFSVDAVAEGTATITLTATDTGGLSVSLTFEVTAQILPNSAPVVTQNISDETVNVGQELTPVQNLFDYFSDPDNDGLRFSATSSNTDVLVTGVSLGRWWINGRSAGTVTVTVTATDEVGASASQEVTVTVVELPNETPIVVVSIPDQSMVVGEADRSLGNINGYFSDPDNDPLTFRVRSSARGTVSVWLQSNELYLRAYDTGSVTITVTATDPGLRSVSQEFTVTVTSADVSPPPPPSPQGPAPRPRADARDPPDAHTR
ncbi:Ig-like domain-containing protein [Candidatus Palauibacter sp.]|uniref:Ig-like domain-containing protein n=1 Tax=Candidatus Palauibacter sp. TaxID=3101350 RepID=UPI003B5CD1E1